MDWKKMWGGAKRGADEVMGIIDSIMTILGNYPDLNESDEDIKLSYQASINPLSYLLSLFQRVAGYETTIRILADLIVLGIPAMELAVKLAMLLNLRHLFSCTINPIITNKLLTEGLVFDLSQIDMTNMLEYSPLKKSFDNSINPNHYNYFGCDGFRFTDELADAGDFNAFLWYIKNKSIRRIAWRGVSLANSFLYTDGAGYDFVRDKLTTGKLKKNLASDNALYQKPQIKRELPTESVDEVSAGVYRWVLSLKEYEKLSVDVIERNNFKAEAEELNGVSWQAKKVPAYVIKQLKENDQKLYGENKFYELFTVNKNDETTYSAQINREQRNLISGYSYTDEKGKSKRLIGLFKQKGNASIVSEYPVIGQHPTWDEWKANNYPEAKFYKKVYKYDKDKKAHGIITLEYNGTSSSLTNSVGGTMSLATPSYNNLHVFIGCAESLSTPEIIVAEGELVQLNKLYEDIQKKIGDIQKKLNKGLKKAAKLKEKVNKEEDDAKWEKLKDELNEVVRTNNKNDFDKMMLEKDAKDTQKLIDERRNHLHGLYMTNKNYKPITQNYYYRRTLFEFNYDYIMSLKLFDAKVIVHQLIGQLTNCFSIDLDMSVELLVVKEQIDNIVTKIIQSGVTESVINDCYFLFDNKEYDKMMQKADLIRSGLYTDNGEINSTAQVGLDILSNINNISENASKEEFSTIVAGSLMDISIDLSTSTSNRNIVFNANVQNPFKETSDFVQRLINNLTHIIAAVILSPKLYLLYAVNLKLVGTFHPLSYQGFLSEHAKVIAESIQSIINNIQEYIQKQLLNILQNLMKQIAVYFAMEKLQYYYDLIKRCIDCFKNSNRIANFQDDVIQYADIYDQSEPTNSEEC